MIVYVSPKPPYPLTSGAVIRGFQLLNAYSEWGRVHLVSFFDDEADRNAAQSLERYCEGVHLVPTRTVAGETVRHAARVRRIVHWVGGRRPGAVTWLYSSELRKVLEDLASKADVVHVARLVMASHTEGLAKRAARPRMILDLDDVESAARLRELRYGPREPFLHHLYGYYDLARLCAYQARAVRRFDRVFVCSDADRRRLGRSNVVVVPNGAFVPAAPPVRRTDAATILFCGTLSYRPNADAVRFFVTAVLPEIRRAIPDARLVIVGRAPAPDIQALHDGNGVVVASNVPSVTEYYANAAIAIVPLRLGGGTRLKILEAWAHGVPVVSTSIGCEGIGGIDGQHLLVADGAGNFAARCIAFLRSADLRERIAKQAWQLVSEQYRWEHIRVRAISHVAPLLASGPEPQKLGEYTSPSDRRLQ